MRNLEITPYVGIGELEFGLSQAQVKRIVGKPTRQTRYTDGSILWHYAGKTISEIDFSPRGNLVAIHLGNQGWNGEGIILFEMNIFLQPFSELEAALLEEDDEIIICDRELRSLKCGFSISSRRSHEYLKNSPIGQITLFSQDYYIRYGEIRRQTIQEERVERRGKSYTVLPYVGVDKVRFGMTKDELREMFAEHKRQYTTHHFVSAGYTPFDDIWPELGIAVAYNLDDVCTNIAVNTQKFGLLLEGFDFSANYMSDIFEWLSERDSELIVDEDAVTVYTSPKYGVTFNNNYHWETERLYSEIPNWVGVFAEGYGSDEDMG